MYKIIHSILLLLLYFEFKFVVTYHLALSYYSGFMVKPEVLILLAATDAYENLGRILGSWRDKVALWGSFKYYFLILAALWEPISLLF